MKRIFFLIVTALWSLAPAHPQQVNSPLVPSPPAVVLGPGISPALANPANANGGVTLLSGSATPGDCLVWGATGIQDLGSPCIASPIGTAPLTGAGARNSTNLANRATDNGASFDVMADYGAVCNGTTDDASAINAALSSVAPGGVVRLPPGGVCRAASTIAVPPGATLDLGSSIPAHPPGGGMLLCDAGVNPCVQLTPSGVASGTAGLRNGTISRSGLPTAGTVGVLINGYHSTINNVLVDNSTKCWVFAAQPVVGAGIHTELFGASAQRCSDAYVDAISFPEIYWFGGRFGENGGGDYAANAYVRIEGTAGNDSAGGPGTIGFYGMQWNTSGGAPLHGWEFVNLGGGSVPPIDATDFQMIGGHIESIAGGGAIIYSDASWNNIDRFKMIGVTINTGTVAGGVHFTALNPATSPSEWDLTSDLVYTEDFVLAPAAGQNINQLKVTGGRISGPVTITGVGNSSATFSGVDFANGLTVAGAWTAGFNAFGDTFSGGTFTNNASNGYVTFDSATTGRVGTMSINPTSSSAPTSLNINAGINSRRKCSSPITDPTNGSLATGLDQATRSGSAILPTAR